MNPFSPLFSSQGSTSSFAVTLTGLPAQKLKGVNSLLREWDVEGRNSIPVASVMAVIKAADLAASKEHKKVMRRLESQIHNAKSTNESLGSASPLKLEEGGMVSFDDPHHNGEPTLDPTALRNLLLKLCERHTPDAFEAFYDKVLTAIHEDEINGGSGVDSNKRETSKLKRSVWEMFHLLDRDRDGFISIDDLKPLLKMQSRTDKKVMARFKHYLRNKRFAYAPDREKELLAQHEAMFFDPSGGDTILVSTKPTSMSQSYNSQQFGGTTNTATSTYTTAVGNGTPAFSKTAYTNTTAQSQHSANGMTTNVPPTTTITGGGAHIDACAFGESSSPLMVVQRGGVVGIGGPADGSTAPFIGRRRGSVGQHAAVTTPLSAQDHTTDDLLGAVTGTMASPCEELGHNRSTTPMSTRSPAASASITSYSRCGVSTTSATTLAASGEGTSEGFITLADFQTLVVDLFVGDIKQLQQQQGVAYPASPLTVDTLQSQRVHALLEDVRTYRRSQTDSYMATSNAKAIFDDIMADVAREEPADVLAAIARSVERLQRSGKYGVGVGGGAASGGRQSYGWQSSSRCTSPSNSQRLPNSPSFAPPTSAPSNALSPSNTTQVMIRPEAQQLPAPMIK